MTSKVTTIEQRYGVRDDGDWFTIFCMSPFAIGQRVEFVQGDTRRVGTVVGVQYGTFFGQRRYDIQVQYESLQYPRWTHPKWLRAL